MTWQRVAEVFDAALDQAPDERQAWLESRCQGEPELLAEVLELLASHEDEPDLLERRLAAPAETRAGEVLGAWLIEDRLGEGGMGTVFRARRADGLYRQQAALKLIRPGPASASFAARFHAERQILAALDHPSIARLLDGGTTSDGRPYLVMEYVEDGVPIDQFCDREGLDVTQRLRLFRRVCAAVAHAHGRLVIHRDIKPSNILVGPDGTPKLLDFGVAKVLDPVAAGVTVAETWAGPAPLSLACAAPEQVRGDPITTATDVYGLGVLLYGLLAGRPPFDLDGLALGEITHLIGEVVPPPPSARTSGHLDPDLDHIVLEALRKDPSERYATVEALSEDVQRHLDHRPVLARTETVTYLARRFVQRHRTWVGAGMLVAAALVLAVVVSTWQAQVARVERDRARAESRRAERFSELIEELFVQADPALREGGEPITALELVERGQVEVAEQLADEPDIQADLLSVLGRVHVSLGNWPTAVELHTRALALRRGLYEAPHPRIAESLLDLAAAQRGVWRWSDAQVSAREGLAQWLALAGPEDPRTLRAKVELARALSDQTGEQSAAMGEAQTLFTEALAGLRVLPGDHAEALAACLFGLGQVARFHGDHDAAAASYQEAADRFADAGLFVRQAEALEGLSVALSSKGDLGERYQAANADALAIKERVLGPDHPLLADPLINLGAARYWVYDLDGALTYDTRALDLLRKTHGDDELPLTLVQANIGNVLLRRGDVDEALALFEHLLAVRTAAYGPDDASTVAIERNLVRALIAAGEPVRAEALDRHVISVYEAVFGEFPLAATEHCVLGTALEDQGRTQEAEAAFREALARFDRAGRHAHQGAAPSATALALLLAESGRADEAEPLARYAVELREAALDQDHLTTWDARSALGVSLSAQGRQAEGRPLIEGAHEAFAATLGEAHYTTVEMARRLAVWGGVD